jgi:hypothetical protein
MNQAALGAKVMQPASDVGILDRDMIGILDRFETILRPPKMNIVDAAAARVEVNEPDEDYNKEK